MVVKRILLLFIIITFINPIFSEFIVKRRGRYRVIDTKGNFAINKKFEVIGDFSEGLARAIINNKGVYIDKSGKIVIDIGIDWRRILSCGDFSEGLAVFTSEKMGNDTILEIKNAYNKQGYIDKTGKIVIIPKFMSANKFINEFANVYVESDKVEALIDKTGKIIFDTKKYRFGLENLTFSEGLAVTQLTEKWAEKPENGYLFLTGTCGFINRNGEVVIKGDFTGARNFSEGLAIVIRDSGVFSNLSGGSNLYKKGKYGFINKKGKIVIKIKYHDAKDFSEGFAAVCSKKGKWGYINKKGKMKIKPRFNDAWPFSEGLAKIEINKKYGFIDKNGELIVPAKFDRAKDFSEGFAAVEINKNWGYIDKNGEYLVAPKFIEAYSFSEGLARVLVLINE